MPDSRPNILFIMTDQQRGDCLGIEGHPVLQTPTLDYLAATGVRFRRAYSPCPSCVPARRSLMSGQFPATNGLVGYRDGVDWDPPATLPGELQKAGYQTFIVGRHMHLHPYWRRYGFDHQIVSGGHLGDADYERWYNRHAPTGTGGYRGAGVTYNDWTARPWHTADHLHHTQWTVNQAIEFLQRRDPSGPFFLVVSFIAPHPPLNPPAFYFERYLRQDLPAPAIGQWAQPPADEGRGMEPASPHLLLRGEALRSLQAGYYGLINHVDDQLRRLLNPIDHHVPPNTLIVFTSDHGEMLGDHYRFRKSLPYEGAARVPLLIGARIPSESGLEGGKVVDEAVRLEDLMPTLLDLAGAPIPESVDGRSLAPLLRGEEVEWRPFIHGEHAGHAHFLTDGRMKYIWWPADGREQLFDLERDPRELVDLAGESPGAERLRLWRERLIDQLRDRPEGFVRDGGLVAGRPYQALMPYGRSEPAFR